LAVQLSTAHPTAIAAAISLVRPVGALADALSASVGKRRASRVHVSITPTAPIQAIVNAITSG